MSNQTYGQAAEQQALLDSVSMKSTPNLHPGAQWFPEAGLGLFIHWGIASVHGNLDLSWSMMAHTSWDASARGRNKVTPNEYWKLTERFKPGAYDNEIRDRARELQPGIVINTRSCDGDFDHRECELPEGKTEGWFETCHCWQDSDIPYPNGNNVDVWGYLASEKYKSAQWMLDIFVELRRKCANLLLLMAISCLLVGVHAHAAPIAANSRVLFLGREATTHTAEFAALYGADSSVTNLNLSVDSFDSTHVWDDLFSGRTASSDSNPLLTKLDEGFDVIVYLGNPAYQQETPELTMVMLMFLQRYVRPMGTEIVLPVLWNATDATTHTSTFEEHAYRIGDALGFDVVPAGLAWVAVLTDGSLSVAESDLTSSPSSEATFTFATSLYSHFFEKDASTSSYLPSGMSGPTQSAILTHSHTACTNAFTATHYTGDYLSPSFGIWLTPVDLSRKWLSAGTSTEKGMGDYLDKLYTSAGNPDSYDQWWGYNFAELSVWMRWLPDILYHADRQALITSEDYAFTFSRIAGGYNFDTGIYKSINDLVNLDPDGDVLHYIFAYQYNPEHYLHAQNGRGNTDWMIQQANTHASVQSIPNHLGLAKLFQDRPDINIYPDSTHINENGNAINAGMLYTIVTGENPALLPGDFTSQERYALNVAYDLIQSMSGLTTNYAQFAVTAFDQSVAYADGDTAVVFYLDAIASDHASLSVNVVTPPAVGSVDIDGTRVTYTIQPGYYEDVTLVYTATDGTSTTPQTTVTISYTAPPITVPATIQGVTPTGSGTDGDPYVYDFGGADLTMNFELMMNANDQNTEFIHLANLISTSGGGVDSSAPQLSPDFKVSATGNIHLNYVDTHGEISNRDAGEISLITTGGNILVNKYLWAWAPNYGAYGGKAITVTAPGSVTVGGEIDGSGKDRPITITGRSISIGSKSEGIRNDSTGSDSGAITLHATEGDLSIAGGIDSDVNNYGALASGPVSLTAVGDVTVGDTIHLDAANSAAHGLSISGSSITIAGVNKSSLSDAQNGGSITLSASAGGVFVQGSLEANGGFNHSARVGGAIEISANGGDIVLEESVSSEAYQDGDLILRSTGDMFLGTGLDLAVVDALFRPGWNGNAESPAYSANGIILINGSITNLDTGNVFYSNDELQGDVYFDAADNPSLSDGDATGKGPLFKAMSVFETAAWSDGLPTASRAGLIAGGQALANSGTLAVTELFVAPGAILGGVGSIDGDVNIYHGGELDPGNSTGALTISGNFTLQGSYECEVDDGASPKADRVDVAGTLSLSGATLDLQVTGTPSESAYVLATYGSLVGNFSTINNLPSGYYVDYNYNSGTAIAMKAAPAGIEIEGNGVQITPGDQSPSSADHTDFGSTETYGSDLARTFSLKNTGSISYTVSGVTLSGPHAADFSVTTQPGGTLNAGSDTTFTITFHPSFAGMRSAIATIQVGSEYLPFTIQAFVTEPIIRVLGNSRVITNGDTTPAREDFSNFGEVYVAGQTLSRMFVIENTGDADMTVTGVNITGTAASDYTVTTAPALTVGVGSSTTFEVTFDPSVTDFRDATVTVLSNDDVRGPYIFEITGQGFAPSSSPYITRMPYMKKESDTLRTPLWDGNNWTAGYEIEQLGYQVGYYNAEVGGTRCLRQWIRMDRGGNLESTSYLSTVGEPAGFSPASWQFVTGDNKTKMAASDFDNGGAGTASPANGFLADDGIAPEEINWILKRADNTGLGNAQALAIGILWHDDGDGLIEDSGDDAYVIKYVLSADHPDGQAEAFAHMDSLLELNAAVGNLPDSDFDGIDDDWETIHFGSPTNATATSDWDLDGSSDYVEFRAGTNPTNALSFFGLVVTDLDVPMNEMDVAWPSATGRTYTVLLSHNLLGSWSVLQSNIIANPPTNIFTLDTDTNESPSYIRVLVE